MGRPPSHPATAPDTGSNTGPSMDLHGSVEDLPVPQLLVGLRGEALTGVLDLREQGGQSSVVYLRDGSPVHAVLPNAVDRLDQMLVESRLISEADIVRAQSMRQTSGLLMGQVLCRLGLVEDEQLSEVLRWQLRRKVTRLFSSGEGTFAISSASHPFGVSEASPGVSIDARALIFPGILASYTDARLALELGQLAGRMVRLRPVSSSQLNELGFGVTHAPLLMHLRLAGFRLDEAWIHGSTGPRPREAKALMLALYYLDLLALDRAERRPAAPVTPTPPPAPALRLATTPLPSPAYQRTPTPLPQLDTPQLLALAVRYFHKGELNRAEEAFSAVARADGDNKRVRGFLAWLHFWKKTGVERTATIEPTLKTLREALRADPTFALGHYFVGELAKLQNDMVRAESAFRAALSHDPNLIDAQRELRLITMRKSR